MSKYSISTFDVLKRIGLFLFILFIVGFCVFLYLRLEDYKRINKVLIEAMKNELNIKYNNIIDVVDHVGKDIDKQKEYIDMIEDSINKQVELIEELNKKRDNYNKFIEEITNLLNLDTTMDLNLYNKEENKSK